MKYPSQEDVIEGKKFADLRHSMRITSKNTSEKSPVKFLFLCRNILKVTLYSSLMYRQIRGTSHSPGSARLKWSFAVTEYIRQFTRNLGLIIKIIFSCGDGQMNGIIR